MIFNRKTGCYLYLVFEGQKENIFTPIHFQKTLRTPKYQPLCLTLDIRFLN